MPNLLCLKSNKRKMERKKKEREKEKENETGGQQPRLMKAFAKLPKQKVGINLIRTPLATRKFLLDVCTGSWKVEVSAQLPVVGSEHLFKSSR